MFAVIQSGLTFEKVLNDLPHDGGAVLVYLMLAAFVALIWRGSRAPTPKQDAEQTRPTSPPAAPARRRRHG